MADRKAESGGSTPKRLGAGDGVKMQGSAKKRVPTPSSRKFCARAKVEPNLRLKLEDALREVESNSPKMHSCLAKAKSLAEITPTQRNVKKGRSAATAAEDAAAAALHATPRRRPPPEASRRWEGAAGAVYRRLLVLAWRRCRQRLHDADDDARRRSGQISQLEMQVEVLKNLQETESRKREDALTDYQRFKKKYEVLELENSQLIEEIEILKKCIENSRDDLEVLSKKFSISEEELKIKKDQTKALLDKLGNCESQLHSKDSLITELQQNLWNVSRDLKMAEEKLKSKTEEYEGTAKRLEEQLSWSDHLKMQVDLLTGLNKEMEDRVGELEISLQLQIDSNQMLCFENSVLQDTVLERTAELEGEKKKTWLKNTKEFALLSVSALQKIAHVLLPAYDV